MRYVVGTGWWASDERPDWKATRGDDYIRSPRFHALWYYAIDKYTRPEKICIVDSASPILPELAGDDRLELISLNHNYHRHRSAHHELFHHNGWLKSVLLSAYYALLCEADYFVYVEQDCLVRGVRWVERAVESLEQAIENGSSGWMLGRGGPRTPGGHELQQSLMIVKLDHLREFIERLTPRPPGAHVMMEERFLQRLPRPAFLPFGFGRARDGFSVRERPMYAQHWSKQELREWCEAEIEDNRHHGRISDNRVLLTALDQLG